MPFYQYDKRLGAFAITVRGQEDVATPEGPVKAWVVDASSGSGEQLEYLIAAKGGRELGYRSPQGGQRLGGDCSGLD